MSELNGVRVGQRVRDLDGTDLGRVKRLWDWGFEVAKGLPLLFRRLQVVRYSEVRGVRDGDLVVARSARDLLDLAEGGVPASWRIPAPHGYPSAATPSEARLVFEDLAAGALATEGSALPAAPGARPPPSLEEGDRSVDTRGQAPSPPPPVLGR